MMVPSTFWASALFIAQSAVVAAAIACQPQCGGHTRPGLQLQLRLRWRPRQMVVPLTYTCTDSRNLPFTSFYVGVKVNAVGVKVKVAAQWLWGVKVNMGG